VLGEDFGEGAFSAWSFEDLTLSPSGTAWFYYTGVDAWPRGNAEPYVWVSAPDAALEACQFFSCRDSATTVVECREGNPVTLSDGVQGCCASGMDEVEFYLGDVSCPQADNSSENAEVWISVEQSGGECRHDLQMQVDFG
jgi:hypothetical protein